MTLASARLAPTALSRLSVRTQGRLYPVLLPVGVFVLTRLFAGLLIVIFSKHQIALGPDTIPGLFVFQPTPADPGYLGITTNWDGQWYQSIATNGYHVSTPGDVSTPDEAWAWAFPPLYPLLAGLLMDVTGLSFALASTLLTCSAGAAAMVLLFRMLERTGGRFLATSGVVLSCCFMSAPLFQAAYSESLALLFLLVAIGLIARRSYWLALLPVVALSFTRLITPVLCVVVVVAVASRVRAHGWGSIPAAERWGAVALAAYSAVGPLVWPTMAAQLMGGTERFNRSGQMATGSGLGWFGSTASTVGWSGVVIVCAAVAGLALAAASARSAPWGIELRTWSVAYPLYVLALTPITGGVLRYALLAPTLGLLLVGRTSGRSPRVTQVAVVALGAVVGLACQWLFVRHMMVIDSKPLML